MKAHPKFIAGLAARGMPIVSSHEINWAKIMREAGWTYRTIAKHMKRAPSTVWRMINR